MKVIMRGVEQDTLILAARAARCQMESEWPKRIITFANGEVYDTARLKTGTITVKRIA